VKGPLDIATIDPRTIAGPIVITQPNPRTLAFRFRLANGATHELTITAERHMGMPALGAALSVLSSGDYTVAAHPSVPGGSIR
jgi:hypothetical protein